MQDFFFSDSLFSEDDCSQYQKRPFCSSKVPNLQSFRKTANGDSSFQVLTSRVTKNRPLDRLLNVVFVIEYSHCLYCYICRHFTLFQCPGWPEHESDIEIEAAGDRW